MPELRALATEGVADTACAVAAAFAERAVVCVNGASGVGKTFAVRAVLAAHPPGRACLLRLRSRPDPADLRCAFQVALGCPQTPGGGTGTADELILAALSARPRIVVADEAHQLSPAALEYLRSLYDAAGGVCMVLIAGQDGEPVLRGTRMLASRCTAWTHIDALAPAQLPGAVRALHPLWHAAPDGLLRRTDARSAHGRLRAWAALTHHAHRMLRTRGVLPVEELVEHLTPRLGPVPR
ncbi:AAA family ATPase [Streptomyces katsurahamanus]|uniref:AAA family ATPase n=1 Tax=Streptomyces katsurahamanus TaxID=2577098 RepID=UPI001886833A|nr:ATP-binding protein [Streptomyces katsurahamanus]